MAGGDLSDTTRLMRVISALSSISEDVGENGRLLTPATADAQTVLDLILIEINETVLRRLLIFQGDAGQSLKLEVAERRVIHIHEISGGTEEISSNMRSLTHALTSDDAPDVMALLQSFCEPLQRVRVVSHLPQTAQDGALDGVSCHDLLQFAQIPAQSSEIPPQVASAIEPSKEHARALVITAGGDTAFSWGDEDTCQAFSRMQSAASAGAQENSVRLWFLGSDVIVMAQTNTLCIWAIGHADVGDTLFQIWTTALAI